MTKRTVPTYTYDDNGNMLTKSKVVDGVTTLEETYTYDRLNRLTEMYDYVEHMGYEFYYDSESRLYSKSQYKTNVEEDYDIYMYDEYYIWDGDDIVAVDHISHESMYEDDNNSFFVRGLDLIAKTPVFNYADERIPNDYYYIQNRHGDVVTIVDYDGNAVNTYEYDEYGAITAETEGINNPFKYAGEVQNMPSSLVYLRNRIYIPRLQRFLQEDPYWNVDNMIYGDEVKSFEINPFGENNDKKIDLSNEVKIVTTQKCTSIPKKLGISETANGNEGDMRILIPSIESITQSGNLYPYCNSNPLNYEDTTGEGWTVVVGFVGKKVVKWAIKKGIVTLIKKVLVDDTVYAPSPEEAKKLMGEK